MSAEPTPFQQDLVAALGAAATFDADHRRAYDHDLGEMPAVLMAQLRSRPDAVVVARTPEQVGEALRVAARHGVPVTPRGQASSGYGGSIATRAGLMLDVSTMDRVLAVDPVAETADVQPGVVWGALAKRLRLDGLDVRTCPTSGPSSTVGGWFAMGGVGIGSLRYGSISDAVLEADVVGLDGQVVTVRGSELELHHQTCGTLGVVTRLRLAVRRAVPLRSFAVHLDSPADVTRLLREVPERLQAYSLAICSSGYLALRAQAEGHQPPIAKGFLALITLADASPDLAGVLAVARSAGGRLLPDEVAEHEWEGRFYPMRLKKLGPALLVGEFFLPAERFAEAWPLIERKLSKDLIGLEAFAVKGGQLAALVYLPDPGKGLLAPVRMAKATIPIAIATRLGGRIYASGLWFAAETERCLGASKYRAYRARKREVDPRGLLNPGKLEVVRPRWFPVLSLSWAVGLGSALAAPLARRIASRRLPATPHAS